MNPASPVSFLKYFGVGLIDLVLPPQCFVCGDAQPECRMICDSCDERIDFIEDPRCGKCGKPVGKYSEAERRCDDCKRHPLRFEQGISPLLYGRATRELILKLKFSKALLVADFFSDILKEQFEKILWKNEIEMIQPVPMFWIKRVWRGYNQAELIAEALGRHLRIPRCKALKKVRHTGTQSRLSRKSRLENLKDAFKVKPKGAVEGKTILLIDDVMTTGTTCSECARVLKEAGASKVYTLTVARAR